MAAHPHLIVALDVPRADALPALLGRLPPAIRWFKVGLELFCADGPHALRCLHQNGRSIFLDLKLHDIPRTVERAVRAAAHHHVGLLTVHACGGQAMLAAAVQAAREFGPAAPKIIAVTVLTSLSDQDLRDTGVPRATGEHVLALADLALSAGVDGLVCSPREARSLRERFGERPLLVVPGIRASGDSPGDQKRTASATDATRAGASFIVVGRPIIESPDPGSAASRILQEIAAAT